MTDSTLRTGIYGLLCKTTGKWYVGQSINIETRWDKHYKRLNCKGQPKIYHALKKYGYDDFDKVILEECVPEKDILDKKEDYWIIQKNSINNGYNIRGGGFGHGWHSEETKQKIREARAKQSIGSGHVSEEARMRLSAERKGKSLSEDHRRKLSISHIGITQTEESKLKISTTMKGKPGRKWTEEQKLKKSLSMIGKKLGPYGPRKPKIFTKI